MCLLRVPDGFSERIREIRCKFEEVAKDREALGLREEDAPGCHGNERPPHAPTTHLVVEKNVFFREKENRTTPFFFRSNLLLALTETFSREK
jgi:hypothetical protein